MKTVYRLLSMTLLLMLLVTAVGVFSPARAASAVDLDVRVRETLNNFKTTVPGATNVLNDASGVLVFPRVYQGGFGIGGQYGEGALLVRGVTQNYYRIVAGSIGFQLGGQRKAIIMAFLNPEALAKFQNSQGWEVGADASVAVITVGAEGAIDTKSLRNQAVIAFVIDQKGLMYTLTLEGSKISRINKR